MNGVTANITNVNATTVDATNVEVTNVKAKDGTAAIVISDTSGNVGIGGTGFAFDKVVVTGTLPTDSNVSLNYSARGTAPSGSTTQLSGFNSYPATAAASFTCAEVSHFNAANLTIGAGSTVTNQIGFKANNTLTGATNNYGFYGNIASGSNRYNVYMAGTADNYFAGNVGINVAPPTIPLQIGKGGGGNPATSGTTQTYGIARIGSSGAAALDVGTYAAGQVWMQGVNVTNLATNYDLVLQPNGGNVGIGGTAAATNKLEITGTLPTSGNVSRGARLTGTVPSGSTTATVGFESVLSTQAAAFNAGSVYHFVTQGVTLGAGSTLTNQFGYFVDSTLTGATNNYGFYSNIASGSNRWNFYAAGTARNYFAGSTGIGIAPDFALHVYGAGSTSNNYANGAASGATLAVQDSGGSAGNGGQIVFGSSFGINAGIKSLLTNGTGPAGDMVFQTRSTSGDVLERLRIDSAGNVIVNTAAIATSATDGFLYVPTCAGVPTGTPSTLTGRAPIVIDTTNHRLYFYSGGSWRNAGP
jgi:hypothetical protein